MSNNKIRLLLVDDHPVVCQGLAEELDAEGDIDVVGIAGSVAEALTLISEVQPDIVLSDMRLPDGTGEEICRHICGHQNGHRFLVLTGFDDARDIWQMREAQANGMIYKSADPHQVTQAVKQVMAGERLWTDKQITCARRWWDEVGSRLATLTNREREVLRLVAQGMSNKDIAATLGICVASTETHLTHLLQKLELKSRREMAAFVWRHRLMDCL
ncbi:MAG: response regulator transcription factor [Anaerolineae bacterium]|nr:response regulator transcription factor [Anaerolineae bacterium]